MQDDVRTAVLLRSLAAPPSIDLNLGSGLLDSRITFTRASSATYFDAAGVLQTAGNNVARFDADPVSHVPLGLLLEETRANLMFPSKNWFSTVAASGAVDGFTQNAGTPPDGSAAAMKHIPGTFSSSSHQGFLLFAGVINTNYVYTVFAKAAGYTGMVLSLENTSFGANAQNAAFDLSNGTIARQAANSSATIQAIGSGWYRCSVQALSLGTAANYVGNIKAFDTAAKASAGTAFTGDGTSGILLWGNDVQAGAFVTSHIPTTSAAVTRAAEVPTLPIGAWYNLAVGSWMAELKPVGFGVNARVIGLSLGNRTPLFLSSAGQLGSYDGTSPVSGDVIAAGVISRISSAWPSPSAGLGAVCANGAAPVSGAQPSGYGIPGTLVQFGADGSNGTNLNPASMWLRRVRYWPRALSAEELRVASR